MLEELNKLYISDTIKPTFENVHVILALYIFGENFNGIGRYRLKEELLIGSGTAKSLITRLNKRLGFISVLNRNIRKGHVLTERGLKFLNKVKKKIPFIRKGDLSILKDIIIETESVNIYFCQIKNAIDKITNGIDQRDAAIKVGGIGATCLVYDGENLIYPLSFVTDVNNSKTIISKRILEYFIEEINESNSNLEKEDIIIIGLANIESEYNRLKILINDKEYLKNKALIDADRRARLSALNAALTLI
ncbi:MAG: DUF4443 domain-containing protein [Promethearchaeota archaeon]